MSQPITIEDIYKLLSLLEIALPQSYSLPTQEIDVGANAKICSSVFDICSDSIIA